MADVQVHPQWKETLEKSDYQRASNDSDIAILKLKKSVQMSQEVHSLPILGLSVHFDQQFTSGMVSIIIKFCIFIMFDTLIKTFIQ